MKTISEILTVDRVKDIISDTKADVLAELCALAAEAPEVINRDELLMAILEREQLMSTGIGIGVAVPHARTNSVSDMVMVVGRCKSGLDFESLDGAPVTIIILMVAPERNRDDLLKIIAKIGNLFGQSDFTNQLLNAASIKEMHSLMVKDIT